LYEFYTFLLCHLFKVENRFNLLKQFNQLNYSFPKSRNKISCGFPQETEVVAALLRDFIYLYKISVYQLKFNGGQAPYPIGATLWLKIKKDVTKVMISPQ
jgi:hypothetical protein